MKEPKLSEKNERTENMKETNSRKKQRGFTLAETLITLVILGIVAAITVPQLVRRQQEAANRIKFKKAMTAYETAINNIVIQNDIKSNQDLYGENGFAPSGTCEKSLNYFKTVKTLTDGDCRFKTADGIFWDISNINKVIVSRKEEDLNTATADSNTNRAFYFISKFDNNGSLRVNDLAYEKGENKEILTRLYDYVLGKTSISESEIPEVKYSTPCPNACDVMGYLGGGSSGCSGCTFETNIGGKDIKAIWNEDGSFNKANYTDFDQIDGETVSYQGTVNSDLSYTVKAYYSTGEKREDYNCNQLDFSTLGCASGAASEDTVYYKNGNKEYESKDNADGSYCLKRYREDGSFDRQEGSACED